MAILSSAGAGVFTPAGFAEKLEQLGDELMPATLRGVQRAEKPVRETAVALFTERGVGRAIFGRRPKGAFSIIRVKSFLISRRAVLAIEATGFAALQEQGGRTKPHVIRAEKGHYAALAEKYAGKKRGERFARRAARSRNRVLAILVAAGGGFRGRIFRAEVNHPGSRIPRHPFQVAAIERNTALIQREIDLSIQGALVGLAIGFRKTA